MTKETTLGRALPIKYGKARTESFGHAAEAVPVYGSSGVIGEFNRALTTGPALIVGRKGSAGSVHYVATPCWPIDTVYYAEAQPDSDLPYFKYLLEHLRLGQHDKSTAIPSLSRDDYNAIPVTVPVLGEQRRVVAYLDEQLSRLDASVAALHRVQANLKRYRASVLKSACEGRLVPTEAELARQGGRDFETGERLLQRALEGNAEGLAEPETKGPLSVPEGWALASVDMVGEVLLGRQRAPQYLTGEGARRYLRVANIKDDNIDFDDLNEMDFDASHFAKYRLEPGDILVSEGQSPELLGQSAIFRGHSEPLCFQKTLHRFRAHAGLVSPEFAQLVFRSHLYSGVFRKFGSITTNIGHLTLNRFKAVWFPLPPLAEQHRIVAEADRRLSVIRVAEAQVTANLARAQRLRQSILQAAFATPA